MKVYVVTRAWEGEILGIYLSEAAADAECASVRARDPRTPVTVEDHEITLTTADLYGIFRAGSLPEGFTWPVQPLKDHGEQ